MTGVIDLVHGAFEKPPVQDDGAQACVVELEPLLLLISDIDLSEVSCREDDISGTVRVTVTNQGCSPAVNFEVALSTDGCLAFPLNRSVPYLAAGASATVPFLVSGSWSDCTDCSCDFAATVDPTAAPSAATVSNPCSGPNSATNRTPRACWSASTSLTRSWVTPVALLANPARRPAIRLTRSLTNTSIPGNTDINRLPSGKQGRATDL